MSRQVEAQHAQRRMDPATRVLILRALGLGIGFLIATPVVLVFYFLMAR